MNYTLSVFTIILCLVSAVSNAELKTNYKSLYKEALKAVEALNHNVLLQYMDCYPLPNNQKLQCLDQLNNLYLPKEQMTQYYFVQNFVYVAEKLGFQTFITDHTLECAAISEGPIYDENYKAYKVQCLNDQQYYIAFDSEKSAWKMIGNI